jgi:hypothetical protein
MAPPYQQSASQTEVAIPSGGMWPEGTTSMTEETSAMTESTNSTATTEESASSTAADDPATSSTAGNVRKQASSSATDYGHVDQLMGLLLGALAFLLLG